MSISPPIKTIFDGVSLLNIWAVLVAILPDITAILSFIWISIRIYETRTFQHYILRNTKHYTRKADGARLIDDIDDMD
jgi:hypothetical protein